MFLIRTVTTEKINDECFVKLNFHSPNIESVKFEAINRCSKEDFNRINSLDNSNPLIFELVKRDEIVYSESLQMFMNKTD